MAVASAGPYASLHLAPDTCQHPTTQFFTGRMPFLPPNQQRQSTEGKALHTISMIKILFDMASFQNKIKTYNDKSTADEKLAVDSKLLGECLSRAWTYIWTCTDGQTENNIQDGHRHKNKYYWRFFASQMFVSK